MPDSPYAPVFAATGDWVAFVASGDDRGDAVELRKISDPSSTVASAPVPGHLVSLFGCGLQTFCLSTEDGGLRTLSVPGAELSAPIDMTSGLTAQEAHSRNSMAVVGSPDGRVVATTAGDSGLVQIRALPSGHLIRSIAGTPNLGRPLAFSPDGTKLAVSAYSRVDVWDIGTGQLLRTLDGHTGAVQTGAWSPDGNRLYTAGLDRQVIAWDLAGEASLVRTATLDDPADVGSVWVVGDTVVAGTSDGRLLFVRRGDGTVTRPEGTAGSDWVATVRSGGSGTLLVAEDVDGTVSVWDAPSGASSETSPSAHGRPRGQPDLGGGRWCDSGKAAGPGRPPLPHRPADPCGATPGADAARGGAALRSDRVDWDGHVLVEDGNPDVGILGVLVIDPVTGDARPIALAGSPYEIATDPDGAWIAFAGQDGNLRFAGLADGHLLAPPQIAVDGQVYNVSVSPDGKYVVTSGAPGQVRLWDTATFREVGPAFPSPVGAATARARFAPDGSLVVMYSPGLPSLGLDEPVARTSGGDLGHGAVIWTYPIGREAWEAQACSRVGRTLTQDEWNTFLPGVAYDPVCD